MFGNLCSGNRCRSESNYDWQKLEQMFNKEQVAATFLTEQVAATFLTQDILSKLLKLTTYVRARAIWRKRDIITCNLNFDLDET